MKNAPSQGVSAVRFGSTPIVRFSLLLPLLNSSLRATAKTAITAVADFAAAAVSGGVE